MQGKVTCSDCGKDFASPRSLANHKNRFHNDKKDSDNESEDSQSTSVTNEDGDIFSQHDDKVSDTDTDISKVSESSRDDHSLNGNVDSNSIDIKILNILIYEYQKKRLLSSIMKIDSL